MTFQDIINEVESSNWQPKFKWVDTIGECSRLINLPHEDHPLGVSPTSDMILSFHGEKTFTWADACNIQKFLFTAKQDQIENIINDSNTHLDYPELTIHKTDRWCSNLPNQHINIGLRKIEVQVGNWKPPHPMFLQDLIERIFPITLYSDRFFHTVPKVYLSGNPDPISIQYWYKLFQTIHPFEDLNGRVGGIILAVLSHSNGQYLTLDRT